MKLTAEQTELLNLLVKGKVTHANADADLEADEAIALIGRAASLDSKFCLDAIRDAVQIKIDTMIPVALAVFAAKAPDSFLCKRNTQNTIISILSIYTPSAIYEFVDLLRSKELGRGFGARPQKWVRDVLHSWNFDTLKEFSQSMPEDTCALIRLVHPKYVGARGDIVKSMFEREKFGMPC